jgi:peptidoglycan/LPS O-acetylase OafA/YrhL
MVKALRKRRRIIMTQQKIYILDSLRGIIALFVALYHFLHAGNHTELMIDSENSLFRIFDPLLEGSVSVFFIISAYVNYLHMERHNFSLKLFGKFILKRFIRIVFPVLLCIIGMVCIDNLFRVYLNQDLFFSFKQFITNITFTAPYFGEEWYNPIFWTLNVEFQFYLLLVFLFIGIRKSPFFPLLILTALSIVANYFWEMSSYAPYYFSYFVLGIAAYLLHAKKITNNQFVILLMMTSFDVLLNHPSFYPILPLLSIPVILFVKARSRFLEWIGTFSYSFYLMHGVFGGTFIYFFGRYATSSFHVFLILICAFLLSYIGSYISYLIVEKPSTKVSSRIRYPK